MEEKKWNAGSIGLTFAGSFLGAGYVSGQELWQFFGSFGGGGLLGVLAAMALLAVFGLALMYIISRTGIAEMDAVLVPWERLAWLRKLSSALQLILLFGVIAIMYAGGGALLEQLFSLPTWLGRTLMAVLVTLVALRGLRGAVGAFSLIVPVIVALTLLFGGMALARYGVSLPAFGAAEGSNPLMRSAAFGAVGARGEAARMVHSRAGSAGLRREQRRLRRPHQRRLSGLRLLQQRVHRLPARPCRAGAKKRAKFF